MAARLFVTGIGTGVGKTIASAVITEALNADYWKPIQTGSDEGSDTQTVKGLVSNSKSRYYPEAFCLRKPVSPHAAAIEENVRIQIRDIVIPETKNTLVIEGAGGLMVPLNEKELMLDLIKVCEAEVVLVVKHYLGSINHTLLSIQVLKQEKIPVAGIIYNGQANGASEQAIESFGGLPIIGRINEEKAFTPELIEKYAYNLKRSLEALL
jgi:dethiobiotin synthetase